MRTNNTIQTVLPVDEATVQERSVSVKVLTIGAKQVTQSLYKQLICDMDVIDHWDCTLRGKVWGWVNLHIDCNMGDAHLHVIWEKDGCLYRSCTYRKCRHVHYTMAQQSLDHLAELYCYLQALEGKAEDLKTFSRRTFNSAGKIISDSGTLARVVVNKRLVEVRVRSTITTCHDSLLEEEIERIKREMEFNGYPVWHGDLPTSGETYARMEKEANIMGTEEQNWQQIYKQIYDAGQLFIAVSGVWK